jgi:2-dehydropantoate 2-reductase
MFSIKKVRNIFIEITREAMAVADAMGIKPELLPHKVDYYKFSEGTGFFNDLKRRLLIYIITAKYRRLKSSSLQSLERGKPTEIDYLNGYIVDNGKKYNVPTPVNDKIVQIVKDIEAGKRKVALDNLNDPFFARFG